MDDFQALHPAIRGLRTVCRCNNIKYRTIVKAIREGAHTLEAVAAKTGATTGHCGGTCTPDVQAMLAEHAPAKTAASGVARAASSPRTAAMSPNSVTSGGTNPSPPSTSTPRDNQTPAVESAANADAWWVRKS